MPQPQSQQRGQSLGKTGEMYHPSELQNEDTYPDHPEVNEATAESFKNFHQDERESRTMKRPWTSLEVDYDFFSPAGKFRNLGALQFFVALFVLVPTIFEYAMHLEKKKGANELREKREAKHAAELARLAEEQKKA